MTLEDDLHNRKVPSSSVATQGAISYRAVDRLVQEDSVQLQWSGKAPASAAFVAKQRVDYAVPEQAALVFDIKVDKAPTAEVKLGMSCGSDCGAEKSITNELKKAAPGQWQTVAVSMNCFSKVKTDMLLSPFALNTSGELGVTLHHIRIESAKATISCQ